MTILYALLGIPLMFIYMANIGSVLATSFKYLYSKLCRYNKHKTLRSYCTMHHKVEDSTSRSAQEGNLTIK